MPTPSLPIWSEILAHHHLRGYQKAWRSNPSLRSPHTLAAGVPAAAQPAFGGTSAVGLAMYVVGLVVETLADGQKWAFKSNPLNAGK